MQTSELVIATPYYMLMDGKTPIGPTVANSNSSECTAIFGFSDKSPYDQFCRESSVSLAPYPMVKGFLRNQIGTVGEHDASEHDSSESDASEKGLKLVVLDASGPRESSVHAATMEAVLQAQELRTPQITPTHHLIYDREESVYHWEKMPA